MSSSVAEATYDYKKLFYMACGYISGLDSWTDKHPMEVVDFFLTNYIDLEDRDII
jgi:hypothetical protein